jgi:hypothetical protein
MKHFYTSRELSNRLEINLARWKRWARSFLPPDPLGGLQSGYARQYSYKELCKVYLGGFLLSHLKLTVLDSRQILADLSPWLKKNGFFDTNGSAKGGCYRSMSSGVYRLFISRRQVKTVNASGFAYLIRHVVRQSAGGSAGDEMITEMVQEYLLLSGAPDGNSFLGDPSLYFVNLSPLFSALRQRLLSD